MAKKKALKNPYEDGDDAHFEDVSPKTGQKKRVGVSGRTASFVGPKKQKKRAVKKHIKR